MTPPGASIWHFIWWLSMDMLAAVEIPDELQAIVNIEQADESQE